MAKIYRREITDPTTGEKKPGTIWWITYMENGRQYKRSLKVASKKKETGETLNVPLVGKVDLIERTDDGNIVFVDYKTASTRYNQDSVQRNLQLTAYSLWARETYTDKKNDVVHLRFDVLLKNKTPLYLKYETQRTYQDAQRFTRMLLMISDAIRQELFYPNPGWQCVDCPFKVSCVADPLM